MECNETQASSVNRDNSYEKASDINESQNSSGGGVKKIIRQIKKIDIKELKTKGLLSDILKKQQPEDAAVLSSPSALCSLSEASQLPTTSSESASRNIEPRPIEKLIDVKSMLRKVLMKKRSLRELAVAAGRSEKEVDAEDTRTREQKLIAKFNVGKAASAVLSLCTVNEECIPKATIHKTNEISPERNLILHMISNKSNLKQIPSKLPSEAKPLTNETANLKILENRILSQEEMIDITNLCRPPSQSCESPVLAQTRVDLNPGSPTDANIVQPTSSKTSECDSKEAVIGKTSFGIQKRGIKKIVHKSHNLKNLPVGKFGVLAKQIKTNSEKSSDNENVLTNQPVSIRHDPGQMSPTDLELEPTQSRTSSQMIYVPVSNCHKISNRPFNIKSISNSSKETIVVKSLTVQQPISNPPSSIASAQIGNVMTQSPQGQAIKTTGVAQNPKLSNSAQAIQNMIKSTSTISITKLDNAAAYAISQLNDITLPHTITIKKIENTQQPNATRTISNAIGANCSHVKVTLPNTITIKRITDTKSGEQHHNITGEIPKKAVDLNAIDKHLNVESDVPVVTDLLHNKEQQRISIDNKVSKKNVEQEIPTHDVNKVMAEVPVKTTGDLKTTETKSNNFSKIETSITETFSVVPNDSTANKNDTMSVVANSANQDNDKMHTTLNDNRIGRVTEPTVAEIKKFAPEENAIRRKRFGANLVARRRPTIAKQPSEINEPTVGSNIEKEKSNQEPLTHITPQLEESQTSVKLPQPIQTQAEDISPIRMNSTIKQQVAIKIPSDVEEQVNQDCIKNVDSISTNKETQINVEQDVKTKSYIELPTQKNKNSSIKKSPKNKEQLLQHCHLSTKNSTTTIPIIDAKETATKLQFDEASTTLKQSPQLTPTLTEYQEVSLRNKLQCEENTTTVLKPPSHRIHTQIEKTPTIELISARIKPDTMKIESTKQSPTKNMTASTRHGCNDDALYVANESKMAVDSEEISMSNKITQSIKEPANNVTSKTRGLKQIEITKFFVPLTNMKAHINVTTPKSTNILKSREELECDKPICSRNSNVHSFNNINKESARDTKQISEPVNEDFAGFDDSSLLCCNVQASLERLRKATTSLSSCYSESQNEIVVGDTTSPVNSEAWEPDVSAIPKSGQLVQDSTRNMPPKKRWESRLSQCEDIGISDDNSPASDYEEDIPCRIKQHTKQSVECSEDGGKAEYIVEKLRQKDTSKSDKKNIRESNDTQQKNMETNDINIAPIQEEDLTYVEMKRKRRSNEDITESDDSSNIEMKVKRGRISTKNENIEPDPHVENTPLKVESSVCSPHLVERGKRGPDTITIDDTDQSRGVTSSGTISSKIIMLEKNIPSPSNTTDQVVESKKKGRKMKKLRKISNETVEHETGNNTLNNNLLTSQHKSTSLIVSMTAVNNPNAAEIKEVASRVKSKPKINYFPDKQEIVTINSNNNETTYSETKKRITEQKESLNESDGYSIAQLSEGDFSIATVSQSMNENAKAVKNALRSCNSADRTTKNPNQISTSDGRTEGINATKAVEKKKRGRKPKLVEDSANHTDDHNKTGGKTLISQNEINTPLSVDRRTKRRTASESNISENARPATKRNKCENISYNTNYKTIVSEDAKTTKICDNITNEEVRTLGTAEERTKDVINITDERKSNTSVTPSTSLLSSEGNCDLIPNLSAVNTTSVVKAKRGRKPKQVIESLDSSTVDAPESPQKAKRGRKSISACLQVSDVLSVQQKNSISSTHNEVDASNNKEDFNASESQQQSSTTVVTPAQSNNVVTAPTVTKKKRGRKPKSAKQIECLTTGQENSINNSVWDENEESTIEKNYLNTESNTPKQNKRNSGAVAVEDFNPRLLLITKREQLDSGEPLNVQGAAAGEGPTQCGFCMARMPNNKWNEHLKEHYGVGWKLGEPELNLKYRNVVLIHMLSYFKTKKVTGNCRMCNKVFRSALGLLGHIEMCGAKPVRVACQFCNREYSRWSLPVHERSCQTSMESSECTTEMPTKLVGDEVYSSSGRLKRASLVKAENKLKEVNRELSSNALSDEELKKHIKYEPAYKIDAEQRQKWLTVLESAATIQCPHKECITVLTSLQAMEKHLDSCALAPKVGYYCLRCDDCKPLVFATEIDAMYHIENQHNATKAPVFDTDNDSDCEMKAIESSEESEYTSSGPATSDDDLRSDSNEAESSPLSKKKKKKKKCTTSSIVSTESVRIYPERSKNIKNVVCKRWERFIQSNYTKSALFSSGKMEFFEVPTDKLDTKMMPSQRISMKYANISRSHVNKTTDSVKWYELKRFESAVTGSATREYMLFLGGPCKTLHWVPLPVDIGGQYLFISCRRDYDQYIHCKNPKIKPALLFLYHLAEKDEGLAEPKLVYALQIPNGPVHCVEFLPSGGYDAAINRLALVAIGTASAVVNVYALPITATTGSKQEFCEAIKAPVIEVKPSFLLTLNLAMPLGDSNVLTETQCLHLRWSQMAEHRHIVAGYSNGVVAIYDITNDQNDNLNLLVSNGTNNFVPLNFFYTGQRLINSLNVHYDTNGLRWILITYPSRKVILFDIRILTAPTTVRDYFSKNEMLCIDWPIVWEPYVAGFSDLATNGRNRVAAMNPLGVPSESNTIGYMLTAVSCVHFSPWKSACAVADDNGDVCVFHTRELNLDKSLVGMFISEVDVKSLRGEKLLTSQDIKAGVPSDFRMFEDDYRDKYGLVFGTLTKTQDTLQGRQEATLMLKRYMRVTTLHWNLNKSAQNYLGIGYDNGFVRVLQHCPKRY